MVLEGEKCRLRPWAMADAAAIVPLAGNFKVARNLMRFAHPYTLADAESFIGRFIDETGRDQVFCIEVDGQVAGGLGAHAVPEPIHEHTLTIGYWLGEAFWGRGIATEAVGLLVHHVFTMFPVQRLDAFVFGWNPASARVLEKNGFILEGCRRQAVQRFGEFTDELSYGLLRDEWLSLQPPA